jgi:K+/H+ antiporter YhaU regulatory subunit KhtT
MKKQKKLNTCNSGLMTLEKEIMERALKETYRCIVGSDRKELHYWELDIKAGIEEAIQLTQKEVAKAIFDDIDKSPIMWDNRMSKVTKSFKELKKKWVKE